MTCRVSQALWQTFWQQFVFTLSIQFPLSTETLQVVPLQNERQQIQVHILVSIRQEVPSSRRLQVSSRFTCILL